MNRRMAASVLAACLLVSSAPAMAAAATEPVLLELRAAQPPNAEIMTAPRRPYAALQAGAM